MGISKGLPSKEEMEADVVEKKAWKRSTMPNAGAARAYMIQTHQVHYYDQLIKDVFDPYRPRDFGSIITGEFKNRPREQAKPGDAQAPFWMEGLMAIAALLAFCVAFRILFSGIQAELAPLR